MLSDYIVLSNSSTDRSSGCAVRTTQVSFVLYKSGGHINMLLVFRKRCQYPWWHYNVCSVSQQNSMHIRVSNHCEVCIILNIISAPCKAISPSSFCRPEGRCASPCQVDGDCATGICEEIAGTNGLKSCTYYDFRNIQEINEYQLMNVSWRVSRLSITSQ